MLRRVQLSGCFIFASIELIVIALYILQQQNRQQQRKYQEERFAQDLAGLQRDDYENIKMNEDE